MLKFFTYLFVVKSIIMFVLIQQVKDHNLNSGITTESNFLNEVLLAMIHPGIFGVVLLFFVAVGNLVKLTESSKN